MTTTAAARSALAGFAAPEVAAAALELLERLLAIPTEQEPA